MKILLTGSTGFVGSHLIRVLKDHELVAISHKADKIQGITKVYSWQEIDEIEGSIDAVVHLAGLAHDTQNKNEESAYLDVNVGLTNKLLNKLSDWNVNSFVYLSSIKAVVDSTSETIVTEEMSSKATHIYGRSKLQAEEAISQSDISCDWYILRPVMIYGEGQKGNLNMLESMVKRGMVFPFKKWQNKRSVLSINNLTYVIESLLMKPIKPGTYFIADDRPVSTIEIIQSIGRGVNTKLRLLAIPNFLIGLCLSIAPKRIKSVANKVLGSLVVDTNKLKGALGITAMPYNTETELENTFS